MATDEDDVLDGELLRTVVRAASLAALHVVQDEKTRTARTMAQWAVVLGAFDDDEDTENEDDVAPGEKRSRRVRERKNWRTSGWWIQLQDTDLLDYTTDAAKVFRGRFRVPHPFFVELVKLAKDKKWFSRGQVDAAGREGIPVELMDPTLAVGDSSRFLCEGVKPLVDANIIAKMKRGSNKTV